MAILAPTTRNLGGILILGNQGSDKVTEIPTRQCGHCNRTVMLRPDRIRPRATCRRCMRFICDLCTGTDCNDFRRDVDRAFADRSNQPYLLRHNGEPVDRIYLPDGSERLVLRSDHNLTLTERTRYRRDDAAL